KAKLQVTIDPESIWYWICIVSPYATGARIAHAPATARSKCFRILKCSLPSFELQYPQSRWLAAHLSRVRCPQERVNRAPFHPVQSDIQPSISAHRSQPGYLPGVRFSSLHI